MLIHPPAHSLKYLNIKAGINPTIQELRKDIKY
jgi:hypothetical protein